MSINILNSELWLSEPRIVAGIMTGTSVDGIDVAFAEFACDSGKHSFRILAFDTFLFNRATKSIITGLISNKSPAEDVSQLNFLIAEEFHTAIKKLSAQSGISINKIDAVGIHGQTLWHFPKPSEIAGYKISSTYQAGSVSALAAIMNKIVVGDFRAADIALGGQGVLPLVPIFDYHFLKSPDKNRIALNIGGIANITILKKNCRPDEVIAFDTGPGNYLIDYYTNLCFNKEYDEDGIIANNGSLDEELFGMLKSIPYIYEKPPKSTGRDFLPESIGNYINKRYLSVSETNYEYRNLIRTLTDFTVWSIAENIRLFAPEADEIIASGGGIHNSYLMKCLSEEQPKMKIIKSEEIGLPADAKEALCFAWLAYRTLGGLPGNMPSVTGAKRESVLGVIGVGSYKL